MTGAVRGSVPRRHGRTVRAKPERVAIPAPRDDDSSSVSRSSQTMSLRDSGTLKPSGTNSRDERSNSRSTTASLPPRDK
jgi:hypothetical protein